MWGILDNFTVSIHASVKDATIGREHLKKQIIVSIHASVKDATVLNRYLNYLISFNPRICKRCDTTFASICVYPFTVSIHASVKDATNLFLLRIANHQVSIHASVKDATENTEEFVPPYMFQSTHL